MRTLFTAFLLTTAASVAVAQQGWVGWNTFDPGLFNGPPGAGKANDSTPDSVQGGYIGLLGTQVNPSAPIDGGGFDTRFGSGAFNPPNATYGAELAIPFEEQDGYDPDPVLSDTGSARAGIRVQFFGNNNDLRVDFAVTNMTGGFVEVDKVHFDTNYVFGPATSVMLSHFSVASDLQDDFGFRDLLPAAIPLTAFGWIEQSVDLSTTGLADLRLADGETAAFRLAMAATNGSGINFDNIAIELTEIVPIDGDYNADGTVDAADYTVWRDGNSADPSQAGYTLWANNFGATEGGPPAAAAVPEPSAVAVLIAGLSLAAGGRRS